MLCLSPAASLELLPAASGREAVVATETAFAEVIGEFPPIAAAARCPYKGHVATVRPCSLYYGFWRLFGEQFGIIFWLFVDVFRDSVKARKIARHAGESTKQIH